jgi:hypothetical protein
MWASAGAAGCWGQGAPSQSSGPPGPVLSATFGCCPDGLYVPAPAGLAPPSSGPAVREMSLRRSFVADFLREFPAPCPTGRQASVGHSSASFASSQNNGGEGTLAGHLSRPTHQPFRQKRSNTNERSHQEDRDHRRHRGNHP